MGYRLPMFPLSTVLFPGGRLSLHIFEPRYRQLVADCLAGSGEFGVVLISRGSEVGGGDQRLSVGSVARIEQAHPMDGGRWLLVADGCRRIEVTEWRADDPYPAAVVEDLHDGEDWADKHRWYVDDQGFDWGLASRASEGATAIAAGKIVRRVRALRSELDHPVPSMADLPAFDPETQQTGLAPGPDDPGWLSWISWQICAAAPLNPIDAQGLLEGRDPLTRLIDLTELMEEAATDLARLLAGG